MLTIFLALGAWRISRSRVLTRRMPAIETLGAATVLCVDKTGTLTLNQMTRAASWSPTAVHADLGADQATCRRTFHELLEFAILASKRDPFDPMEKALHAAGRAAAWRRPSTCTPTGHWSASIPLSPGAAGPLATSGVAGDGETSIVAAKGAPEAIADLCHLAAGATRRRCASAAAAHGGAKGCGCSAWPGPYPAGGQLPGEHSTTSTSSSSAWSGLADPVRPDGAGGHRGVPHAPASGWS